MRNVSKLLHIMVLATIVALLVAAIPASPALAVAEDIELDPERGEIGDWIDIEGEDFTPSDYTPGSEYYSEVDIYFSREEADRNDDIGDEVENYERVKSGVLVDEYGDLDTRFKVPAELTDGEDDEEVHGGTYYVYATYHGEDNIEAVAEFTVIAGVIGLDPDDGPVGTEAEITGEGFTDDEDITVEYDDDEVNIVTGDDETDDNGEFTCTIIIPESTAGEHTITVTDDSGSEAEAEFTVEPEITVTSAEGAAGDTISVKGTGFGEDIDVTIEFDSDEVAEDETDYYGSFEVTFTVPVKSSGTYEIEVEDEDGNKDDVDFTIAAGVKLSQTTGNVGSEVTVSGSGFIPNATVTITYATEPVAVATTTADAIGKFSATFTVPKSKHGQHTITATDGTNTVTTIFTMESAPPTIPLPLLPQMGVKAESPVYFDWDDVTDPSGVTYTLQVAADESFTDIVLEKTELAESEYTLTKEEKLESTKKEAPYYWRVRAIDGASNMSEWSGAGSFYVGFTFQLTGWVLYTLIGIVGLLLLAFVYLMGRRRAAS